MRLVRGMLRAAPGQDDSRSWMAGKCRRIRIHFRMGRCLLAALGNELCKTNLELHHLATSWEQMKARVDDLWEALRETLAKVEG